MRQNPRLAGEVDSIVGDRVRAIRLDRGLSQNSLAQDIGVTYQQLQKYEAGRNRISVATLCKIARSLGIRPHDLLPAEDPLTD